MKTQKVTVSQLPLFANDDIRDHGYVGDIIDQAHVMRSQAMRNHLRAIAAPVAKWFRDMRTQRALEDLSDDVLHDIGIERANIPAIVAGVPQRTLAERFATIKTAIANYLLTQRTVQELENLSDAMLDDIGIDRAQVKSIAAGLVDGTYNHYDLRAQAALKLVHGKTETDEPELPLAA